MKYKDILVYLDPTPASAARLAMAAQIALVDGGYVIGVDASTDEAFQGEFRDAATNLESAFHLTLRGEGVPGEFHVAGPHGRLETFALPADLVIAPSPSSDHRKLIHAALPDEVVMHAGAPVLVVPTDWAAGVWGKNVVIAWNGGREVRRAVREALPILQRASKVTVFAASRPGDELRGSADRLTAYLGRYGVTAQVSDWANTGDATAIEALFASLDTQTADLLVAGAFGHSRWYESLFGSVSHDLLRQPVLPVLMSH